MIKLRTSPITNHIKRKRSIRVRRKQFKEISLKQLPWDIEFLKLALWSQRISQKSNRAPTIKLWILLLGLTALQLLIHQAPETKDNLLFVNKELSNRLEINRSHLLQLNNITYKWLSVHNKPKLLKYTAQISK
jgi:hypothetical protein